MITLVTGLLTAITGLIIAFNALTKSWNNNNASLPNSTTATPELVSSKDNTINSPVPPHDFTPPEIRDFLNAAATNNLKVLSQDLTLGLNADITLNDDPTTALVNAV